jgi:hypothetical protein
VSHELVRIDVSDLTRSEQDMLWMRLRAHSVPFSFDGSEVSVPEERAGDARAAMEWIADEMAPMAPRYDVPRPFRRTLADGSVIAARWSRLVGWIVDSVIVATLYVFAERLGVSPWFVASASAVYFVASIHLWGRTVGKLTVGVVVVAAGSGARPSWLQATVRWLVVAVPGLVSALAASIAVSAVFAAAWIGTHAPILWDARGQGVHDRITRTYVLRRERTRPDVSDRTVEG